MSWSNNTESFPINLEIEKTYRQLNREKREWLVIERRARVEIVEHKEHEGVWDFLDENNRRALRDFATHSLVWATSSIIRLSVSMKNFEVKPIIIYMIQTSIQFRGSLNDDPNVYFSNFLEIYYTFK